MICMLVQSNEFRSRYLCIPNDSLRLLVISLYLLFNYYNYLLLFYLLCTLLLGPAIKMVIPAQGTVCFRVWLSYFNEDVNDINRIASSQASCLAVVAL